MLKENASENQEDEKVSKILGELEYCEEYSELGETGTSCDYCTKIHTPSVAIINTINDTGKQHKGIENNISPDISHYT